MLTVLEGSVRGQLLRGRSSRAEGSKGARFRVVRRGGAAPDRLSPRNHLPRAARPNSTLGHEHKGTDPLWPHDPETCPGASSHSWIDSEDEMLCDQPDNTQSVAVTTRLPRALFTITISAHSLSCLLCQVHRLHDKSGIDY